MKLFKRLTKSIFSLFAIASLVLPGAALADSAPRFNQMQGDREFLMGRNITQNQSEYSDPVGANQGDVVRVSLYYHNNASQDNGQPGTAARNVRVSLAVPTQDATSHLITGTLGADNAETVSGTIVDGQEVGQPGLTINTGSVTRVSFVPGSVKWFPNGSSTAQALPNGQSGDEIVTGQGLNLGDINGCWQFAGFVTADVILPPAGQPNIIRSKSAVNQSQGGANASDVNAKPGDVIVYTLTTKNTGTIAAPDVSISDEINDVLEYANFVSATDQGKLEGTIVQFGSITIAAGETVTRSFTVRVKAANEWPASGNFVMSNVYGNRVDVPVETPKNNPNISIEKQVKNITQNFDYRDEVTAHQNDLVEFRFRVKNTSSVSAKNVVVRDLLPAGVNFQPGSVRLERDGKIFAISDDVVTTGGYHLDSPLKSGEEITFYLRATVGKDTTNGQRLRNIATASATDVGQVSDDATVIVEIPSTVATTDTTTTTPPVTPTTPSLPMTGPADIFLALFSSVFGGASGMRFYRAKRALKRATEQIAVL